MQKQWHFKQFHLAWVYILNFKKVLFQTIQFSISTQFSSTWAIDWALSGATTLGQSGPEGDGDEWVLRISQSPSITEASQSECLESLTRLSLKGPYCSAQKQSVYSTGPAEGAKNILLI